MFNWVFSLLNIVTVLIYFFFFNLIPLRDLVFAASAASIEVSVIARQDDKVCDENLRYYDISFNCLVFFSTTNFKKSTFTCWYLQLIKLKKTLKNYLEFLGIFTQHNFLVPLLLIISFNKHRQQNNTIVHIIVLFFFLHADLGTLGPRRCQQGGASSYGDKWWHPPSWCSHRLHQPTGDLHQ